MLPNNSHFKLFAHCIPVKGAKRSVICDLQRRRIEFLPNSLYDLLTEHKLDSIGTIKQQYGTENEAVIEEYFQFLVQKEFLFLCDQDELQCFPDLDLSWEVPNQIENAIIDAKPESQHDYASIFHQLEDLGCVAVQLRNFYVEKYQELKSLLDLLQRSRIESIEIITAYSEEFTVALIQELAEQYPRLSSFTLHSAPSKDALLFQHDYLDFSCSTKKIDAHTHCGLIAARFFSIALDTFLESQKHNSCLNHKIAIDVAGQIKNCPSLPDAYGNIATDTLQGALHQKGFKKLWTINKDQISVCRDCEFRHICTDCRAFVEQPDDQYSKPLKCGYDPYTNEWQDWSSHPMKEKAIAHYDLSELVDKPVSKDQEPVG